MASYRKHIAHCIQISKQPTAVMTFLLFLQKFNAFTEDVLCFTGDIANVLKATGTAEKLTLL